MDEDLAYPRFLICWSNEGLESVVDLTFLSKTYVWDSLQSKTAYPMYKKVNVIVGGWMLRARYNPQRRYEIYAFNAEEEVSEEEVVEAFKDDPQSMADTIRKIGQKIHATGMKPKSVIN